jgi:peptidoglycan/LPS O-acetylase OafA/YrhL
MTTTPHRRRNDIDWLRVLAMLVVFTFHCGRFFNNEDWHVKNLQTSYTVTISLAIVSQWMMPLFFVLSGMSSYYALGYKKPARYVRSRFKRLVVPLIFGIFVIIAPLQVYLERVSHSQFQGSFLRFYPHYFHGWYGLGGNFAWMGVHLWYLEILFVFSLIMLPLFICLRSNTGAALLSRTAAVLGKPGCIFLVAIPVAIMECVANIPALRPTPLGIRAFGGWSLLPYLVFFSLGYVIAAEARFSAATEKHRIAALTVGIAVTLIGFYLVESRYPIADWVAAILRGLNAWAWLIAILGFGSRYLNFSNRFLKYANEAVLPFYILHQTVILAIGYYIVRLHLPIAVKFFIIATGSFVAILGLYDVLVKRINMLRFLFGMKLIAPS